MIDRVDIRYLRKPDDVGLNDPVMIEGLPGIGHVGKLVADHLVKVLDVEKVVELYSHHFPPQVMVDESGMIKLPKNEVYAYRSPGDSPDLLILVGDYQSINNEGHYELANAYIKIAKDFNVSRIYTLGGYGVGKLIDEPYVIGAVNDTSLLDELKEAGVRFENGEPAGGIIGAAGLIIGLAMLEGIPSACLMGTTSGYMVDPKSAKVVLEVLMKLLKLEVSTEDLEERAKEMEKLIAQIKEMQEAQTVQFKSDEDLAYFR